MGNFTKFFSSSKRPVLIGKTITKQIGDKTEFENTIKITNALKAVGMYEVFTYNPDDMTVTYDFIEGADNYEVNKVGDAWNLIASYSKPIKAKLPRIDELHKSMTGYVWDKRFYKLIDSQFNCLCHDDINKVNIILDSSGKPQMIDWERASLGPKMYDMGSWLVNQCIYLFDPKKKGREIDTLIDKAIGKHPQKELIEKFALIDASFVLTHKHFQSRYKKVYGIAGLEAMIEYLTQKYL